MSIVAVGKGSFLARAVAALPECADWRFLSHREARDDPSWADDASLVINFAFCPDFKTTGYDEANDIDTHLARLIADCPVHYMMLSSRQVYGPAPEDFCLKETMAPAPDTPYGQAKIKVERSLVSILGEERVTILRLSNIFGPEYGRQSFFGLALSSLRDRNKIVFDMSPDVPRDFLAVGRFASALVQVVDNIKGGVYNLGAGFGTPCGDIARWLIEGYGQGTLEVTAPAFKDPFYLDMSKTRDTFGVSEYSAADMKANCLRCGQSLQDI